MSYYAPEVPPPPPSPPVPPAPPRRWGRELLSALVVALAVGVSGVLLGLAWWLVAPPLPVTKVEGGVSIPATVHQPEELAAQDGWFAILGLLLGVLAAVGAWTLARRNRGPIQLFALLIGTVAAGFLAWQVGTQMDEGEYRRALAAAPAGSVLEHPVQLSVSTTKTCLGESCVTTRGGSILVPALGTVIAYAVLAGWSRWPSLRREEDEHERLVEGWRWPELGEVRRDGPDLPKQ